MKPAEFMMSLPQGNANDAAVRSRGHEERKQAEEPENRLVSIAQLKREIAWRQEMLARLTGEKAP